MRDPQTPGYVAATLLEDGATPPIDTVGNYIVGPTHTPDPATVEPADGLHGHIYEFVMESTDSAIYPGIARDKGMFGTPDPDNPARLIVTTSRP